MTLFAPVIDVQRRRGPFCGPTAIAILTGVPVSRVEHMLHRRRPRHRRRDIDGRRIPIKGTGSNELISVLEALGCKVEPIKVRPALVPNPPPGRGHTPRWPTFGSFVEDHRHVGTMLITVTGHYMVSENGMVADTEFKTPVAVETYPRKTRRVHQAWRVTAPAEPRFTPADPLVRERPRKPKPDIKAVRYERTLAKIKRWQARAKRATTELRKLNRQKRYYEKTFADQGNGATSATMHTAPVKMTKPSPSSTQSTSGNV